MLLHPQHLSPPPPHCISSSDNYLHRTSHHQAGKCDLPGPSTNAHISAVLPAHGALQTHPDVYGLTRIYLSIKHCCSQSTSISTWLWQKEKDPEKRRRRGRCRGAVPMTSTVHGTACEQRGTDGSCPSQRVRDSGCSLVFESACQFSISFRPH